MFRMVPCFRSAICGITARPSRSTEKTLVSKTFFVASMVQSINGPITSPKYIKSAMRTSENEWARGSGGSATQRATGEAGDTNLQQASPRY